MEQLLKRQDTQGMTSREANAYVKMMNAIREKKNEDAARQPKTKSQSKGTLGNKYAHRARTVEGAAEASRNMHNVDPAEREAMRAQYDAEWTKKMARPARAKTQSPPKGTGKSEYKKGGKNKSKSKTGKKSGGRFTQKRGKSMFTLF